MYTKRMKIRSVGELKKMLETVPDDARVYACGGSTEDHAVWAFVGTNYYGDDCISLDEDALDDDVIICEDDDEYYSLCEKDIYFDEETQKSRLMENETDNAFEVDSLKYYRATAIMLFDDGLGNNAVNYDTFYDYCCGDLGADLFDYWYNNSDYRSLDEIHDMTQCIERAVNTMIYEIENEKRAS